MYLTWFDNNSWLIEMGSKRILLDPWLVGSLVFGNLPWLFKGTRQTPVPIPDAIDAILLSQGLEDHAHPETLKALDRSISVIASPNATPVVQELGYNQITTLEHGQSHRLGALEIRAFPGAPIGPMLVENAYLLTDHDTNHTLYYEPHGFHTSQLRQYAPIDVVIAPMITLSLPVLGPILRGDTAVEVAQWVQPQVMVPTANAKTTEYEGILINILNAQGNADQVQTDCQNANLSTRVQTPQPGQRFELNLAMRTNSATAA